LTAAVVLALAACGKGSEPTPSATGQWSGSFVADSMTITVNLVLKESARNVTGTGTMGIPGVLMLAQTVTGTHTHPHLALTLSATGYQPANITGEFVNAGRVDGTIFGSGFSGEALTLTRQ